MDISVIRQWYENNYINYILFAIAAYGILMKCVVALIYKGLLKASDIMGTSENKLMKLLRMKFETCYKLKIGVKNVDSFVDKYIYKYRFMGMLLYTWESIGGQVLILSMLAGSVAVVLSIVAQCGEIAMLSTLLSAICVCAVLVIVENMLNLPMKRKVLRVNIIDYLDNFLKARLENEYLHPEELDAYYKEYFTETLDAKGKKEKKKEEKKSQEQDEREVKTEKIPLQTATGQREKQVPEGGNTVVAAQVKEAKVQPAKIIQVSSETPHPETEIAATETAFSVRKILTAEAPSSVTKITPVTPQMTQPAADIPVSAYMEEDEGMKELMKSLFGEGDRELERLKRQKKENEKLIKAIDNAIANREKTLQRESISQRAIEKNRNQEVKIIEEVLKEYLG